MDRRIFIAGGAGALAVAAGTGWYLSRTGPVVAETTFTPVAADGETADTSGIVEMTLGDENAPVTLTEYASFTCPHCAAFHASQFQNLKSEYIDTGKVRFVYRDVYFDRFGLWAAMVARCDPNRFFGISDMLYEQQREWLKPDDVAGTAENLRRIGRLAGLDNERVEACISDQEHAKALVAWFQENATEDDITSTPTILIDGTKHSNMGWDELKEKLDAALES